MPRTLNQKQTEEFFQLLGDAKNVKSSALVKIFGRSHKNGIKFYQDDLITIGPDKSKFVKEGTITTLGIYIFNKFVLEDLEIFGYVNKTIDGGMIKKISKNLSIALMEDDVTCQQVFNYIDHTQWLLGGTLAHVINTSLSSTLITLPPKAKKMREKLLKDNKAAIDANDPQVSSKIATDVTAEALADMEKTKDPAMALFDAKCGIDPYNNYRTMFVMKGPVKDNTGLSPTGYKIVTSNYNDGVTKEDMPKIADTLVTGAYARGVSTQKSGYSAKKYNSRFQRSRLGPKGSDCHTDEFELFDVTDDNINDFRMYHYIMENGSPKLITPKNAKEYLGKTVKLRTPKCCKMKEPFYCNICYGDRMYRLGIENVGNTYQIAAGSLLNAGMKSFHDSSVKTKSISVNDWLKYSE